MLVRTQDLVATLPQLYTLPELGPHLQVLEPQELTEVLEDVHHTKIHQHISDLLTVRVMGLSNFGVDIPYNYGILLMETGQSLLHIGEVLQCGGGEVSSDEQGPRANGYDLTAHHVRTVESVQLHNSSVGLLYENQDHSPLRATGSRGDHRRTHHIADHPVMKIRLACDLGIGQ